MENSEESSETKRAQLDAAIQELLHLHRNGHKTSVLATALRYGVANSTLYRHFRAALRDIPPSTPRAGSRRSGRRKLNENDRQRVDAAVADLVARQQNGQKASFGSTAARFGVAKSTLYLQYRSLQAASSSVSPRTNKGSIGYILTKPDM